MCTPLCQRVFPLFLELMDRSGEFFFGGGVKVLSGLKFDSLPYINSCCPPHIFRPGEWRRLWQIVSAITSSAEGRHNIPRPCKLTFDLESGVRVTCDVGYLCANFSLARTLCSRLRPDVRDKQT